MRGTRPCVRRLVPHRRAIEYVTAHLKTDGSAEARVRRTIDAFFAYAQDHPLAWRILFQESTGDVEIVEAHRRIQSGAHMIGAASLARELRIELTDDRGGHVKIEMLGELWGSALKGLARWWYDRSDVPARTLATSACSCRARSRSLSPRRSSYCVPPVSHQSDGPTSSRTFSRISRSPSSEREMSRGHTP
jgi:hypothetical protein